MASKLLRFWELEVRPLDVAEALDIHASNSTAKKRTITSKIQEAWEVLQHLGYEVWVVPSDYDTERTMIAMGQPPSPAVLNAQEKISGLLGKLETDAEDELEPVAWSCFLGAAMSSGEKLDIATKMADSALIEYKKRFTSPSKPSTDEHP